MENIVLKEDLSYIHSQFLEKDKLHSSTILITGCAGFLGFTVLNYLATYSAELGIKKIIALDSFQVGKPVWLDNLTKNKSLSIEYFNIANDSISSIHDADRVDYIIHLASIASPVFYRKYPIETMDANIKGLRQLLDYYLNKPIKGFLFFSTSEIYGDPAPDFIPTPESYRGNVSSIGPRACYDESKRFGETLCYVFAEKYNLPITIVRPFNNYGPGMKLNDGRAPADFANCALEGRDILIHSDGSPTRTFCYVADAVVGYLKALVYGKFDYFNIGIEEPEISILNLAKIYQKTAREVLKTTINVRHEASKDSHFLTHNPERRCPIIKKAKDTLNYQPTILIEDGIKRFLQFFTFKNTFYNQLESQKAREQ